MTFDALVPTATYDSFSTAGYFDDESEQAAANGDGQPRQALHQVDAKQSSWTAAELMSLEFPELRWAVPGIIADGVTLLVGAPKLGKSWLALGVSIAIASGTAALGRIEVEAGDVLYLALEDNPRRLQTRLEMVLAETPAPDRLTLAVQCEPLAEGGAGRIRRWLDSHHDARLVVIDVFSKVRGHASERNRYDADYAAMSRVKEIADEYGIAIIVVHHTRKASSDDFLDSVSGTHGLAGAADAVILLARSRGEATATLSVTGRDVAESEHALELDASNGTWTVLEGPASDFAVGETRRNVLRLLRESGSLTPQQVADHLGIVANTSRQTLVRMCKAGQVDTDGDGRYFLPPRPVTPGTHVTP